MFKWILALIIAISIFSNPVKEGDCVTKTPSFHDGNIVSVKFVKDTAKNILITTNNVLEVIIKNIDRTTTTQIPNTDKKIKTTNF